MRKILSVILASLLIYIPALTACTATPVETTAPEQTVLTVPTDTESEKQTGEPATESESETTAEPETTKEEEPTPYGIFTYTENKVNVTVDAPYAILIDAKTNEILYLNCDPEEKIYPASTTKVLTAIVALKYCAPDVVFKPGDELSLLAKDSSIAYVKKNHELSLEMLIEGMMLPSGGDAAYVVAAGVGRKIAKNEDLSGVDAVKVFVDEMNRYGKEELGLKNSHFTCPDGYHDDDHYTTIIDIMTVAYAALSEPIIMKYAATQYDKVTYASGHKNTWENSNLLIDSESKYFYEYCNGLKTGTTDEAGCCLLSSAAFSTKKVIAGVFGAKNNDSRFSDSRNLLKAGIEG